jgi:uncharacterized protein (DUF2252 family)
MNVLHKILEFNNIDVGSVKIDRIETDPFSFFRGTSHLFFEHLKEMASQEELFSEKDLLCWIQGDAHINNLGFSNKSSSKVPEVRFDINDFDESSIGNPLLDLIRFGVSIGLFFDGLSGDRADIGLIYRDTEFVEFFLKNYIKFASIEDEIEMDFEKSKFMRKMRQKSKSRALNGDLKARINKFTTISEDGKRAINYDREDIEPIDKKTEEKLSKELNGFKVIDIAKRTTAGVGSANLDRYYALVTDEVGYYLLIEIKEQICPSYLDYFTEYREFVDSSESPAQLVIKAKEKMVKSIDIHLNSISFNNKSFLQKSVFNAKYSAIERVTTEKSMAKNMREYLLFSAIALSNAHKRSALNRKKFVKRFKKIKKREFYRLESLTLKSYVTNLGMYTHFIRELNEEIAKKPLN